MLQLVFFILIECTIRVTSRHVTEPPVTGVRIIDGVCLSKRTDRLVYRAKNNTHAYIGFDVLKKGVANVFTWKIVQTTGTFISSSVIEETMLAVDFRKQVNRQHIVGATGRRHEKNFRHRLERKMSHCKKIWKEKKKHCKLAAIASLLMRLKMRKVSFNNVDGCD